MRHMKIILMVAALAACGRDVDQKPPASDGRIDQVKEIYLERLNEAAGLRDPATGWLDLGCDGFKRTALYAASPGVTGVDLRAAEYPNEPGRFHRRPLSNPCWTPELGDVGSRTTWSRDMGMGLLAYAWAKKDLLILKAHADYGVAHPYKWEGLPAWEMGEPFADGRAIYTPAMLGLVYQGIYALGGGHNDDRVWPNIYTKGLTDYQAQLQMMDIWFRGEVAKALGDADAMPQPGGDGDGDDVAGQGLLQVSGSMWDRIEEHHRREPLDPFYAYMWGLYGGDMSPAIESCLNLEMPLGEYARDRREVRLAYWIFACGQLLEAYEVTL